MLVSHRYCFVYTKTLKTAGTSIEAYFEPYCVDPRHWSFSHARQEYESTFGVVGFRGAKVPAGTKWWNHMPASAIKARLGNETWERYHRFCAIRNPFDKVVSAFFFAHRGTPKHAELIDSDLTVLRKEFTQWVIGGTFPIDRDKYVIDGQICVHDVIRYERLADDLDRICTRLSIPFDPEKVPSLKSGFRPGGASVAQLYDQQARDMVASAYSFELEKFGYEFPRD